MPFGMVGRMGQRYHLLDGVQPPHGKGNFIFWRDGNVAAQCYTECGICFIFSKPVNLSPSATQPVLLNYFEQSRYQRSSRAPACIQFSVYDGLRWQSTAYFNFAGDRLRNKMHQSTHCLHNLLPSVKALEYSLRNSQAYSLLQCKYQLFKMSFVNWCLFSKV